MERTRIMLALVFTLLIGSVLGGDDLEKRPCKDKIPDCKGYISVNKDLCTSFVDFAKMNCLLSCKFCTPPGCTYKNETYSPGETWQDGCEKKCTCSNVKKLSGEVLPEAHCEDVCESHGTLPQGCHLVKEPGKCCPTVVGEKCSLIGRCFDKFNNVTRKVGETWRVECRLTCRCRIGKEGYVTQCSDLCPAWDFRGRKGCKMMEPLPNKCCSAPCCPNYKVPIPPEYQHEIFDHPSEICQGF